MKAYTVNNHLVGVGNSQILGTDQGGGGGVEYEAGQYISIDENNVISVTGLAPATAIPDTSDMATKTWVGEQGYLTSVPSEYATDSEVSAALATAVSAVSAAIPTLPETEEVEFEELNLDDYALASAIPAAQVNSDWNANSGVAEILNKPDEIGMYAGQGITIEVTGASAIISSQGGGGGTTYEAGQYIAIDSNDVISVTGLAQADWNSSSGASQILNKPTEKNLVAGANVTITESNDDVIVQTTEIASGLQLVAGAGITLTVSGNYLVVGGGADETVLWESDSGSSGGFTLSENPLNFERIRVVENPYYDSGAQKPIYVHEFVPTTQYTSFRDTWVGSSNDLNNGYLMVTTIQFTGTDNKTVTRQSGYYKHDNSNSISTHSSIRFYKFVGINRKA